MDLSRARRLLTLLCLASAMPVYAQYGEPPGLDVSPPNAPETLYRHERNGDTLDQWLRVLESQDADRRLEVMDDLGRSPDTRAITYLLRALDDPDVRIEAKAIAYLGNRRSSDATSVLVRKLFSKGAPTAMRQHILAALGKIGDPNASRAILDFVGQEKSPEVRGTAVYALGEIGDVTICDDLRQLGRQEPDPRVKHLVDEAVAKIVTLPRPKDRGFVPPSSGLAPSLEPGH
jgi:HEAT repeats/PBS lyase HEAT-like repeat